MITYIYKYIGILFNHNYYQLRLVMLTYVQLWLLMFSYDWVCSIMITYGQLCLLMLNYDWIWSIMFEYVDFTRFSWNFMKLIQNFMVFNEFWWILYRFVYFLQFFLNLSRLSWNFVKNCQNLCPDLIFRAPRFRNQPRTSKNPKKPPKSVHLASNNS